MPICNFAAAGMNEELILQKYSLEHCLDYLPILIDRVFSTGVQATFDVSKSIKRRVSKVYVRCANCTIPKYEILDERRLYKVWRHIY